MVLYIELSHCGLNRRVTIMPPLSNQFCQYLYSMHVNSLWHSDAIWCYVSTLTQVIRARRIQNFSLARLSELCIFFLSTGVSLASSVFTIWGPILFKGISLLIKIAFRSPRDYQQWVEVVHFTKKTFDNIRWPIWQNIAYSAERLR